MAGEALLLHHWANRCRENRDLEISGDDSHCNWGGHWGERKGEEKGGRVQQRGEVAHSDFRPHTGDGKTNLISEIMKLQLIQLIQFHPPYPSYRRTRTASLQDCRWEQVNPKAITADELYGINFKVRDSRDIWQRLQRFSTVNVLGRKLSKLLRT